MCKACLVLYFCCSFIYKVIPESNLTHDFKTFVEDSTSQNENGKVAAKLEPRLFESIRTRVDPEAFMKTCEILRYHHYPCEDHRIMTTDGYILTIQHIPHGVNGPNTQKGEVVLIQHGFLCTSASWVLNIGSQNLPNYLADHGYDVWLGNIRGNSYGLDHINMTHKDKAFWDFSFSEMANYDIPAMIDYILANTGAAQLFYIGHSMGTAIPLAMLSTRLEYSKKVKALILMSPAFTLKYMTSPLMTIVKSRIVKATLNWRAPGEFIPHSLSFVQSFLSTIVCRSVVKEICSNTGFWISGSNEKALNKSRLAVIFHHIPDRASIKTFLHFGQQVEENSKFAQYDYGPVNNLKHYGQTTPPVYEVGLITTPMLIMWGKNDRMTVPHNAIALRNLTSMSRIVKIPDEEFHHADFVWALNAKPLVYSTALQYMRGISQVPPQTYISDKVDDVIGYKILQRSY